MKKNLVRLKIQIGDIPEKYYSGDYFLGLDLKERLQAIGYNARIDYEESVNVLENTIVNIVFEVRQK